MRPAPDLAGWLTTHQAARRLGLSGARTMQLAKAGQLRTIQCAHGLLYDVDSVEALRLERAAGKANP